MSKQEAINIIKTEIKCVNNDTCDRDCGKCELVMLKEDVLDAYKTAIRALELLILYENISFDDEDEIYE